MKCPHCNEGVHEGWTGTNLGADQEHVSVVIKNMTCPECKRMILRLAGEVVSEDGTQLVQRDPLLLYPQGTSRPIPQEVTGEYAEDFREACLVLPLSPKASAALSRRLLQHIIREKAGIKKKNLYEEIEALTDTDVLAPDLAEDLDAVRQFGNIATHTTKDDSSGEILNVEPGEAEYLLDVVEELLQHYFVRPAIRGKKRAALKEKLNGSGKPPPEE